MCPICEGANLEGYLALSCCTKVSGCEPSIQTIPFSLRYLFCCHCPLLKSLPPLPSTLQTVEIIGCRLLLHLDVHPDVTVWKGGCDWLDLDKRLTRRRSRGGRKRLRRLIFLQRYFRKVLFRRRLTRYLSLSRYFPGDVARLILQF